MEDDFEGLGVSGENDEVSHASVEGLSGLVSSFLQLYHLNQKAVSKQVK